MWIFKKALSWLLLTLIFIGAMFVSVSDISLRNRASFGMEISFATVGAQATQTNGATATTSTVNPNTQGQKKSATDQANAWLQTATQFMNAFLGVLTVLVSPAIMLAWWLLSPDWVTGDMLGLRTPMYNLWVTVSNMVYFIYAILLIVVALGTIFNVKNYTYKQMLPKLFVWIIMVPFTWFFVQFTISASTILTSAVMEIPMDTISKLESGKDSFWKANTIPKTITSDTLFTSIDTIKMSCKTTPENCTSPEKITKGSSGIYGPMLIYAYNVFKIHEVKAVNTNGIDVALNLANIVTDSLIAAIMFLAFGLILIAIVAVLLKRALYLWFYTMLSPLFTLKYVFKDQWKWTTSDNFTVWEFFQLAFVPAVVGLVLSFGLIVVSAINTGLSTSSNKTWTPCTTLFGSGCVTWTLMGNPENTVVIQVVPDRKWAGEVNQSAVVTDGKTNIGLTTLNTINFGGKDGISIKYYGSMEKWTDVNAVGNGGAWFLGMLGSFIVKLVALVIMWVAFKSVGSFSKVAKWVVEKVSKIGEGAAAYAGKGIKVPLVGSVGGAMAAPDVITQELQNRNYKFKEEFTSSFAGKAMGLNKNSTQVTPTNNDVRMQYEDYRNFTVNNNQPSGEKVSWMTIDKTRNLLTSIKDKEATPQAQFNAVVATMRELIDKSKDKDNKFNTEIFKEVLQKWGLVNTEMGKRLLAATSGNNQIDEAKIRSILASAWANTNNSETMKQWLEGNIKQIW